MDGFYLGGDENTAMLARSPKVPRPRWICGVWMIRILKKMVIAFPVWPFDRPS